jgi:hypothetical protein
LLLTRKRFGYFQLVGHHTPFRGRIVQGATARSSSYDDTVS